MAVIDFHSHILPGIDDGSKNVQMSLEMLKRASEQGVDVMLATSHFYASRHRIEDFLEKRQRAYERLAEAKNDFGPAIRLGAEVAFFSGISRADRLEELAVEGSHVLLLEMPFSDWSRTDIREVEALISRRGFQVVLAHLERYLGMPENKKWITELLEMPLYVQINAESLLGWRKRGPLLKMFKKGQAHFLGSDCHRLEIREPNLGRGREVLIKKLGKEFVDTMDERGSRLLQIGG
ncbi:MAG TPA: capsular polysaccharide biosynthesis protein [Candidatus Anaerobutyricum avicola]|nr:capsular polysaccharide biosynthesis protein [Candidatus Anaerobutyricum avicola]